MCLILKLAIILVLHFMWVEVLHGVPIAKVPIVDLTYRFRENETLYWPGSNPFKLTPIERGDERGFWLAYNKFYAPEHGGSHMDAPYHINQEKWTLDKIPIEHFFAPGVRIDISRKAARNRDALVEVNDIVHWEERNGRIPDNAVVLLYADWGKYWPNAAQYQGRESEDDLDLSFPGLDPNAAQWLAENRKIVGVGIDTPSMDHGPSTTFGAHVALSKANIFILENVANMDKLPGPTGFTIVALPMKIYEGTGAPTRIIALLGDSPSSAAALTASATLSRPSIMTYLIAFLFFMTRL